MQQYRAILDVTIEQIKTLTKQEAQETLAFMIQQLNRGIANLVGVNMKLVQVDEGTVSTMLDPIVPTTNKELGA